MSLWGKLIGMGTGYILGGVEGALVGGVAGHAVDVYTNWAEAHSGPMRTGGYAAASGDSERRSAGSRYNFTLAIVSLGAKLAKADGPVLKSEIAAFKEVFRVPAEEVHNVGSMFDRARTTPRGYEAYAEQLANMFRDKQDMLDEIVGCLFHVALADGALRPEETDFIRRVSRIFGFSDSYFQRRLDENANSHAYQQSSSGNSRNSYQNSQARAPEPVSDPYVVLGVSVSAPEKDIKIRYHKLVRQHHPDNLTAAGKSKADIQQATAKLALINAAYDQIVKERQIH